MQVQCIPIQNFTFPFYKANFIGSLDDENTCYSIFQIPSLSASRIFDQSSTRKHGDWRKQKENFYTKAKVSEEFLDKLK